MEIKLYLAVLWRRKWVIGATVLVATIITAIGSSMMTPQYSATATLWVPTSSDEQAGSGDILLADRLMNTYAELVTSRPVLTELERQINVSPAEVKNSVKVQPIPQTELLQIIVQHPDPQLASTIATNLANIVIVETQKTEAGRDLRVSLFVSAGVPKDPIWLGTFATPYWREINIALAFAISLVAGLGLAFLFEYLDTTLNTTKQIEDLTKAVTLGQIPIVSKHEQGVLLDGNSLHGEAFRYLRTSIFSIKNKSPRALLIASALPKEGKSTIIANLALAIAQSKRKVIVVDADLRQPTLHKIFNLSADVGLSTLLEQEATLAEVLQESGIPGVQVITSGPLPLSPAELLDLPQTASLIEEMKQMADFVLIDTPAVMAVTDAAVLAPLVDGVALVVGRTQANQEAVQAACRQLVAVKAELVGVIVNRAEQAADYYHRYMAEAGRERAK